eukprot:1157482-Pelagomonas_calceolata.AAC.5
MSIRKGNLEWQRTSGKGTVTAKLEHNQQCYSAPRDKESLGVRGSEAVEQGREVIYGARAAWSFKVKGWSKKRLHSKQSRLRMTICALLSCLCTCLAVENGGLCIRAQTTTKQLIDLQLQLDTSERERALEIKVLASNYQNLASQWSCSSNSIFFHSQEFAFCKEVQKLIATHSLQLLFAWLSSGNTFPAKVPCPGRSDLCKHMQRLAIMDSWPGKRFLSWLSSEDAFACNNAALSMPHARTGLFATIDPVPVIGGSSSKP